jgi:hypothetical protein
MKKLFYTTIPVIILGVVLTACSKSIDDLNNTPPVSTDSASYMQLSISGMQMTGESLYALLSIENNNGSPVVTNKKVTIDNIQGTFKTDKIKLNKGGYKLTKFLIFKSSDTALYATPKINTPRASQVTTPLAYAFTIAQKGIAVRQVQVLKIAESDSPDIFGYTSDDFGFMKYINIRLKLKITVGSVLYDSLPGKVLIKATNNVGATWVREVDLQRGLSTIKVPEEYQQFSFEVSKWNTLMQKNLNRTDLQNNLLVSLESVRLPKRLIEESSFIENSAGLIPDSRTEYFYNVDGRLSEIKNYQRSIQVSGLPLTNIYKFKYDGYLADSIIRYSSNYEKTGYTSFTYGGDKITNIANRSYDQETYAAIEYSTDGKYSIIGADYLFSNGNAMTYIQRYSNGNKISDQAQSSTGGGEGGSYEYDDNINPKHQLGWPDLYFTNYSKNNLMKEQKGYGGSFPSVIPYKFEYIYDNDGYPIQVFVSYKGFHSQQHLYRLKKTYRYQ